jgi:hypothetical protein
MVARRDGYRIRSGCLGDASCCTVVARSVRIDRLHILQYRMAGSLRPPTHHHMHYRIENGSEEREGEEEGVHLALNPPSDLTLLAIPYSAVQLPVIRQSLQLDQYLQEVRTGSHDSRASGFAEPTATCTGHDCGEYTHMPL